MFPRQGFIRFSGTMDVKIPIYSRPMKRIHPLFKLKMFFPRIKLTPTCPCSINNLSESSVSTGKDSFQHTTLRLMKFYANVFSFYSLVESFSYFLNPLHGNPPLPLVRCIGLRDKR